MTSDADAAGADWFAPGAAKHWARLDRATLGPQAEEIGRVEEIGDGVARISGLPACGSTRLCSFDKGAVRLRSFARRRLRVNCVLIDPAEND